MKKNLKVGKERRRIGGNVTRCKRNDNKGKKRGKVERIRWEEKEEGCS